MTASIETTIDSGLQLLRELLQIPSPSGQERPAVDHLVRWMADHGFSAHRDAAGNAVGVLNCPGASVGAASQCPHELLLLGHIDTVCGFPRVMEREGRLYGRGAVDAKGPLAAFASAAAHLGPQCGWRLVVVGAVEEEAATSKGARHLIQRRRPDMVVIGEPTGWDRLTLGYKGRLLVDVQFQQRVAHTAGPQASAVELAAEYWQRVLGVAGELNVGKARPWDQLQASLRTFNSADDGLIETADLRMGFRLPMGLSPSDLKARLVAADGKGVFRFSGEELAFRAEKNTPLVRAFVAAVRSQGGGPSFLLKTGTSDMNVVGPAWQCPILAYGPGDSALDHTPEEHVELAEWGQGVKVLIEALRRVTESA